MRKIFFFIIAILISCSDGNKRIEIIPNEEWEYLDDNQVTEVAIPTDTQFEQKLENTLYNLMESWHKRIGEVKGWYPIYFTIYIGETGKVEKIKNSKKFPLSNLTPISKRGHGFLKGYVIDDKVIQDIIPVVEEWNFTPANFVGNKVKYKKTFGVTYQIDSLTDGEFKVVHSKMDFFPDYTKDFLVAAEEMPMPIGGMREIAKNVHYPEIAKRAGIEGRVFVKAFIDENGNVVETEIIKGIGGGCDQAALDAIEATKFKPGRKNGKPVKVQVSIPIMFKLD